MNARSPRVQVFAQLADLAKALAHPHRLELLQHVAQGERSVERLTQLTRSPIANTSQHLQHLRRSGLVKAERKGKQVFYSLGDGPIIDLLTDLRRVAERNDTELRELTNDYFNRLDTLEPVSRKELIDRLKDGTVTILDVRPEDEFEMGHLPGAVSVPAPELEKHLASLPRDQEIVAYCRGTYCVMSFEVVAKLRDLGFRVRRLEEGYPEWKAAGLAVETAAT